MFSGPSTWEISRKGEGKSKVCFWSQLRGHFCSEKSSHFYIQSWLCSCGEVIGGCCEMGLLLCPDTSTLSASFGAWWLNKSRMNKIQEGFLMLLQALPMVYFSGLFNTESSSRDRNRLQTLSFTVCEGISYTIRITFGLINYFNFSSLNCVLQCTLLKVLSVPLKCPLLLQSYRKNSTKCPDSPFALM